MSHRLLIVTGPDRPGIVSAVSVLLARHGINLEDLRMTILEGEFAMMVVARIPNQDTQTALDHQLKKLEKKWSLSIFQCGMGHHAAAKRAPKGTFAVIRVLGKDKTGIVAGVSRTLAGLKCNITDLQCRILGAGTRAFYTMILECVIPPQTSLRQLKSSLKRIERSLAVEIKVQSSDVVQL